MRYMHLSPAAFEAREASPAFKAVEAAGIEPERRDPANYLMANDFRRKCLESRDLPPPFECPGVPSSPLESTPVVETFWRRAGSN